MNLYDYCIQNELSDLLKEWNVETVVLLTKTSGSEG